MKEQNRSKSGRKWPSVVAGILLGIRTILFAFLFIANELAEDHSTYIDGKALTRALLIYVAVPGIFSGIALLLSLCLKTPSVKDSGNGSKCVPMVKVSAVAAAAVAVLFYWIAIVSCFFYRVFFELAFFRFLACSCFASAVSLILIFVCWLMKKHKIGSEETNPPEPETIDSETG